MSSFCPGVQQGSAWGDGLATRSAGSWAPPPGRVPGDNPEPRRALWRGAGRRGQDRVKTKEPREAQERRQALSKPAERRNSLLRNYRGATLPPGRILSGTRRNKAGGTLVKRPLLYRAAPPNPGKTTKKVRIRDLFIKLLGLLSFGPRGRQGAASSGSRLTSRSAPSDRVSQTRP